MCHCQNGDQAAVQSYMAVDALMPVSLWKEVVMLFAANNVRSNFLGLGLLVLGALTAHAGNVTLSASPGGDAVYSWNSKYGPYGYTAGGEELNVGLNMGGQYGNDYTMGFMELPLTGLNAGLVEKVELRVYALGFDTYYGYGSAGLGWLDTTGRTLTGDVVADNLGSMHPAPGGWAIWSTDMPNWLPGWKAVDVTSQVLLDLNQGRGYSSFFLWGSRDTTGSIYAAEKSGLGPYLNATLAPVPEADQWALLMAGLSLLALRLRHNGGRNRA